MEQVERDKLELLAKATKEREEAVLEEKKAGEERVSLCRKYRGTRLLVPNTNLPFLVT